MYPVGAAATIGELTAEPHPSLARLRAAEPVSWLPVLDGWLVTRHDLAVRVMRDAGTFTVDDPRFSTATVVGPSMLSLDGAAHTTHRNPFSGYFRPAAVDERFGGFVTEQARLLVERLRQAGQAELRRELAGPLAVAVMAHSLGLPGTAADRLLGWYDAIVAAVDGISAGRPPGTAAQTAMGELRKSVEAAVADRRSALLTGAAATLDLPGVVSNAAVLMFGGIETTEGMTASAIAHLLGHPDQLALVQADRSLLAAAVEESLRLEPAAAAVDRYATRDVELGGAAVRAGDLVRVSLTAANRDPEVFADPDAFDVRRPDLRKQLAFAYGPHFCLGADLARLQARIATGTVLDLLPGVRLAGPVRARGLVFRKPVAVDVTW
ncbi:MAG TPA: cytochrome P450 [Pseudonocardiaceae bacterium]|nr:cytochrome P450 [Pseudonocardiaceae bacterium]